MRLQHKFEFPLWPDETEGFPTTTGRALRFRPDMQEDPGLEPDLMLVNGEFDLTRLPAESEDYACDAVECRVWIADDGGKKWTAASRFPAYLLLDELAIAQQRRAWSYYYAPFDAPLDSPLVEGATWSTDSREVLALPIGEEDFYVQLKHSALAFDIAVARREYRTGMLGPPHLRVQLREGLSYEGLDALREMNHPDWLPSISFELVGGVERLMFLGGAVLSPGGSWEAAPFPAPLVFAPTDEEGDPQPGVLVS